MSEETTYEVAEAPEVPRKSRKTLIAVMLIAVVGVAAVSVLFWWFTQNGEEPPPTPSPEFNTYSKYGFSFQYPKGRVLSEQGMLESTATSNSGIVLVELDNDEIEITTIGWMTTVTEPDLESALTAAFLGMEGTGADLDVGQLITSTKAGHTIKYQSFTATIEGETLYGIWGVWYCDTDDRFYQLGPMCSEQDVLSKFQQYLDSFVCH